MRLTPLEIRKQEFRKAIRGLDPIEVQTFLEMVAEHYETVLEENKALSRRQIELETQLKNFQENERTLKDTLINVQEVKKQSEESSRRQADLLVKEAELKALEILENARKDTRHIREEAEWLKTQKESFINRLRHILISQIELLSVMELDDIVPDEMVERLKAGAGASSKKSNARPARNEPPAVKQQPAPASGQQETKSERIIHQNRETTKPPEPPRPKPVEKTIIRKTETKRSAPIPVPPASTPPPQESVKAPPSSGSSDASLSEEDINNFFKKGIQIDDLIKNLNKKDAKK